MTCRHIAPSRRVAMILLLSFAFASHLMAQTVPSGSLRGQITDESGAVITGVDVELTGTSGSTQSTTTANDGSYSFTGLPPGDYTVQASSPQLVLLEPAKVSLKGGVQTLNLQLKVAPTEQNVTVQESLGPAISTDSSNNAGALALSGSDLDALADDPDDLAADLQALAGPSAGPNGGAIFIDGFSGGQLPPKESIREIRINQNPFSPEYDTLGYGRIEIFTKPGTDKFHGTTFFNFGDSFWNSRNAYSAQKAPFLLREYGGGLSGPLNHRASFTLDVQGQAIDNGAIINGSTLDPQTLAIINPFTQVFRIPQLGIVVTPHIDYQLNSKNTLAIRYTFSRADITDAGIGSFNLLSAGFDSLRTSEIVQLIETAVLGPTTINETRFQFLRVTGSQTALNSGSAIQVLGAFNGGASLVGHTLDTQNNYELTNTSSLTRGAHSWKFGVRLRGATDDNISPQNVAGTFTFGGGLAPELNASNQQVLDASGQPVLIDITSIERYQRTLLLQQMGFPAAQIRALGGGATQFTINAGNPAISVSQIDAGLFAGDDWRVRPNLTMSLGLRYEIQNNIHDRRDVAPRLALAWAPGSQSAKSAPKNVIRLGFGMFYDRFSMANTLTGLRYNGIVQQQYVVANPDFFPTVPSIASLAAVQSASAIQAVSPTLHAPYVMQAALAYERQLPFHTTLAVTYAHSHGLHILRSQDINAPLPGTFNPQIPGSGVFPLGSSAPVFLMESSGLYNQNQVITNVNSTLNRNFSLFGSYVYNRAMSNTDGLGTFSSSPYSMAGEYGPAANDVHHRVSLGGTISTKWGLRFNPLLTANSSPPFNITVGQDLYGDTLFNGRPGIATDPTKPGVIATSYGLLDPNPASNEGILPRNFGRGPGAIMLNLSVRKLITFGPSGEGAGAAAAGPGGGGPRPPTGPFAVAGGAPGGAAAASRRYTLAISMSVRNILNHNNPGPIIGNITSPLFGQANQPAGAGVPGGTGFSESANNRRLELQVRFSF
jgi:Carboxypeptidase regulatory-like domain